MCVNNNLRTNFNIVNKYKNKKENKNSNLKANEINFNIKEIDIDNLKDIKKAEENENKYIEYNNPNKFDLILHL